MTARDPYAGQLVRHGSQWWDPLLQSARLALEAFGMRRILEDAMARMGFPADSQEPYRVLAAGAGSDNALEQADHMLALVAETRPEEFRAHFWRGVLHLERRQPDHALPHLERAAAWFSGSALAFSYAARIERERAWLGREVPLLTAAVSAAPDLPDARRRLADIRRAANPREAAGHYLALAHAEPAPLYGRSLADAQAEAQARLATLKAGDDVRNTPLTDGGEPARIRPLRAGHQDLDRYVEQALDASLCAPITPCNLLDRLPVHILPLYSVGYHIVRWEGRVYAVDWHIRRKRPHHLQSTPEKPVPSAGTVAALQRMLASAASDTGTTASR